MTLTDNDEVKGDLIMEKDFGAERSEIQEFFEGRSIFITGAGGYLGGVFLEQILRLCPGIVEIFILLREKKGFSPERRREYILNKPIFWKVKEENPKAIEKVVAVAGDLTEDDLGLSAFDIERLKQTVSVVVHCASLVSFSKSFRETVMHNVVGTDNILKLCKMFPKLDAFIYASSAYANSFQQHMSEKLTKMPFSPKELADKARAGNETFLNEIQKKYGSKWPNTYCFTKSVAENLVADQIGDIPVAIIKPSIISHVWKYGSLPGYIEKGSAFADLTTAAILGFLQVLVVDGSKSVDTIPADIVANTLIVGAWIVATKREDKPLIVNCTSSHKLPPVRWSSLFKDLRENFYMCISPYTFCVPETFLTKHLIVYRILAFLFHYIPAYGLDLYLRQKGEEPKFQKGYSILDRSVNVVHFFATKGYSFTSDEFESLKFFLNERDRELFCTDVTSYAPSWVFSSLKVNKIFQFKGDDLSLKLKQVVLAERMFIFKSIYKYFLIGMFAWLTWYLLKIVFNIFN